MPKRNREKLMEQSMYDLLCSMNEQLDKNGMSACIMDCLMTTAEAEMRCRAKCEDCIAAWMNEFPF